MRSTDLLDRISLRGLGLLCQVAFVGAALCGFEAWSWHYARQVFEGSTQADYWFAPDGTATYALSVERRNWGATPVRHVYLSGAGKTSDGALQWYDENGSPLEWTTTPWGGPGMWRCQAELRRPVHRGEWTRYTVWHRGIAPGAVESGGEQWGIYQDTNGDWVFHNHPGLGSRNVITFTLPEGAQVVSAEPSRRARIIGGRAPVVQYTNLGEPHTLRWRMLGAESPALP